MAAAVETHIRLARQLPLPLINFFKRFPPPQLRAAAVAIQPISETATTSSNTSPTSSSDASASSDTPSSVASTSIIPVDTSKALHNPFLAFKNPRTGNWHSPHYSLRRQAVLYKLARQHGVLSLMPLSPKHPEVKEQKRIEKGLRVQGTGVGQKVKGKMWERQLRNKLEERRRAMEGMPEMIKLWKERGHGRGWKKWPK